MPQVFPQGEKTENAVAGNHVPPQGVVIAP